MEELDEKGFPKILIVDDEPSIVRFLTRFLEEKGYTAILAACNAQEALHTVEKKRPDVVLLDLFLPDRHGLEVLQEIKQSDPQIGVIVITGEGDNQMGRKALKMGAFDFIRKPLDMEYLERVLWWQLKTMISGKD